MATPQSLAGYIREHLPEIEQKLRFGVRQYVIVEELKAAGFITTIYTFRNLLFRARKVARTEKGAQFVQKPLAAVVPKASSFKYAGPNKDDESNLI